MGIKPGIYLTALYSFILLLFLFWLLIYHGLVNYGTVLEIKTEPAGAAVRVNGVYLGNSGTKIPLPGTIKPMSGIEIEIVLPGFEPAGGTYNIPGRVFGTRFFPRVYKLEYTLHTTDPAAVLAGAANEFAAWSFGGEPTEAWQIPMVLSEAAYRIGKSINNEQLTMNNEILIAASRFAVTRTALRDLTRAKFLLDNSGNAPSPTAITNTMQDILIFLSDNPESAEWLASLLPPETSKIIRESRWYLNNTAETASGNRLVPTSFGTVNLEFAGLSFTGTQDFLISTTPVSKPLFKDFLSEHPEWEDHYIDYFEDEPTRHPAQIYDNDTATGMSWYVAEAFCEWLTNRLPANFAGYKVRLPELAEWFSVNNNYIGWEWCRDPFAPLSFRADKDAIEAVGSPERTLYGRQNANSQLTRASMPPDFCSPIVTFRVIITRL